MNAGFQDIITKNLVLEDSYSSKSGCNIPATIAINNFNIGPVSLNGSCTGILNSFGYFLYPEHEWDIPSEYYKPSFVFYEFSGKIGLFDVIHLTYHYEDFTDKLTLFDSEETLATNLANLSIRKLTFDINNLDTLGIFSNSVLNRFEKFNWLLWRLFSLQKTL
ncbi:MAG: hypothetical protein M0P01_13270 [Treponema sp.]|nr:hypothetical protein [Treponema sp.]